MVVDDNFVFRSGKYVGNTYGWVLGTNPSYIDWVVQNQPNMLKPSVKYKPKLPAPTEPQTRKEPPADEDVVPKTTLSENLNFLNEGPNGKLK